MYLALFLLLKKQLFWSATPTLSELTFCKQSSGVLSKIKIAIWLEFLNRNELNIQK